MLRESDNAGALHDESPAVANPASTGSHLEQEFSANRERRLPCVAPNHQVRPPVSSVREPTTLPRRTAREHSTAGRSWAVERWCLRRILTMLGHPSIGARLWDGVEITGDSSSTPRYWLHIQQRHALWRMLADPAYFFMEGYARGEIEIEGDLAEFMCELNRCWRLHRPGKLASSLTWSAGIMRRRSIPGSRSNVAHHYDLGNDFYRLWLDEGLLYTCAYFPAPGMTLEAAQIAKMDHVCRKLRLKPGDEVIEAGCGWGALALHMARHYGVKVKAYNVSVEQLRHARQQAQTAGLADRAEFVQDDWRNITGRCDAFVSVGMLEHVGPENFSRLGRVIQQALRPQGRGLIHAIGQDSIARLNPWIERRIFPGAQPPALEQMAVLFAAGDLTVHDVENLRLHYAETLAHWLGRFEEEVETIRQMYDESFVRMWRMYLASSYSAFQTGGLQLFQVLFTPATNNDLPRSRADFYRNADHSS